MEPKKKQSEKLRVSESHTGAFDATKVLKYFKNQQPHTGKDKFVDPVFPPNEHSIMAQDAKGEFIDQKSGCDKAKEIDPSKLEWKRIDDIFSKALIFEESIEFDDILQGNLGNCYFLSALSALTEMPYLLYQIFRTREKNDLGFFEVVLYIDGEWQVVIIDDNFVVNKGTNDLKFAKTNGRELWAIILEKAWAKVNGGYVNTIAGNPSDALMTITGFSVERIFHDKIDKEKLWHTVQNCDKSDNIMCTSTSSGQETTDVGLVENHAYTLIAAKEGDFDGEHIRLLKIRNPWGNKEWHGDYSDKSKKWTNEKRKYFNMDLDKDDGCFCITFEDFIRFYSDTNICYIMYDCDVKNFKIKGNEMSDPHVYNLYIDKDTKMTVSAVFRHWRFNRFAINDSHPTTIMMGKYDENRKLSEITGEYSANFNVEVVRELKKGWYVIWIFCNYEDTVEPKPEQYIVKFAGNSDFKVKYVGIDGGCNFVKHMFLSTIKDRYGSEIDECTEDSYDKIDNQHDACGIGFLYCKLKNPKQFQHWTCDTSGMVAMSLLPPFRGKAEIQFGVEKNCGEYVVLGMRQKQYGTYWFNVESSYSTYPDTAQEGVLKKEKYIDIRQEPNLNVFLSKAVKKDKITNDYYDYHSASVHVSKNEIEFSKIDVSLVEVEELKKQYPEFMAEIQKFNPHKDINEKGLTWSKFNYGQGSGFYIGQFKNSSVRHGRGLYQWDDDKSYYVGYWIDGKKEIQGKFVNGKGRATYEGDMKGGEKNGSAVSFFSNGDHYKGEFKDGFRDGKGIYYWKSGSSWEGTCKKGQLHGTGIFRTADGEESEMTFENGAVV